MLLDTSGLLCYLLETEPHHELSTQLLMSAGVRVVHTSIISELIPLAQKRRINKFNVLKFATLVLNSRDFTVVWLSEADHRESLELLKQRPDKKYSLCDAASFLIMRRMNIREALTTDHHFEQEGFVRLLK